MKLGCIVFIPLPSLQKVLSVHIFSASKKSPTNRICYRGHDDYFFDDKRVIYQHALLPKIAVNGEYYGSVLTILGHHISRKRPKLVRNWSLHHDNACPYIATYVQQYLKKCNIEIMPHPAYSPDLAPCDFWLFRR